MSDIVRMLRVSESDPVQQEAADEIERLRAELAAQADIHTEIQMRLSDERDALRAQLDAANEALLIGEMMLSELGINASEKCQMAYDHLNRYRTSDE